MKKFTGWNEYQSAKYRDDHAWDMDDGTDKKSLRDGQRVVLLQQTVSDWHLIPAGSVGVITCARTPRVTRRKGVTANFFANVNFNGVTGRVPHSAIKSAP